MSQDLRSQFQNLSRDYLVSKPQDQTFCLVHQNKLTGLNHSQSKRIASLSKIFTTYFALKALNPDLVFETQFHLGEDSVHIEGGNDPYFEEEKMFLLIQALNKLGINKIRKLTFDQNFLFNHVPLDQYIKPSSAQTLQSLKTFFSQSLVQKQQLWNQVLAFSKEENVDILDDFPDIKIGSIHFLKTSDLKFEGNVYLHQSLPLWRTLKSMNVQSKNYVAENIYELTKKKIQISEVLSGLGASSQTIKFYNGSGLPIIRNKSRLDNLASCQAVLKVLIELENEGKDKLHNMTDLMALSGGLDFGSFRHRFIGFPETRFAVTAKTGTLKHTSAIAGFLQMEKSLPFVIINQTTQIKEARRFQDHFISEIFFNLGASFPVPYDKISIFPVSGIDFFQPL